LKEVPTSQTGENSSQRMDRKQFFSYHGPVLLGFIALIMLANLPLVLHIRTHVVGRSFEDAFEELWYLSWMETAVFKQHINPFYTPNIFYPQGWYIASSPQPGWYFLLLAPLTHLLGVVTTYNLAMLGAYVVAGFGVYLLIHHLLRQRLPGIIGGCVYSFASVCTLRLSGHTNVLWGAMFLPYAVLSFYRAFSDPAWRWRRVLLAGVMLALTVLSLWYFLFIATLPLIGLALLVPTTITKREWIKRLVAIGLTTLVIIAPFAVITWVARQKMFPGQGDFPLIASEPLGLSPTYLLIPNIDHPIWGDWSRAHFPVKGEQNAVAVGYTAFFLAIVGGVFVKAPYKRAFLAAGGIALILALGPLLQWNNARVTLPAPLFVADFFQKFYADVLLPPGRIAIPLPGLLLYRLLPFYASMRVWARFTIPVMLVLAVLAGLGVSYLLSRGRGWRYGVILLGIFVVFEGLLAPYRYFTDVSENIRPVDRWLAAQPAGTTLIEYPRYHTDKIAMFSQSIHGQRIVNGYMSVEPICFREVTSQLGIWPTAAAIPILREWGVQYMIVSSVSTNAGFQNEILPEINRIEGICLIQTYDNGFMYYDQTRVYKVLSATEPCPGDQE